MSNSYQDLIVWQKSLALVTDVYRWTEAFPRHELYGLTSQMRRAAVSVVSNIAEGQARNSPGEFRQFLGNARGSLVELETQLHIAANLGYITRDRLRTALLRTDEINRLLNGLIKSLARKPAAAAKAAAARN